MGSSSSSGWAYAKGDSGTASDPARLGVPGREEARKEGPVNAVELCGVRNTPGRLWDGVVGERADHVGVYGNAFKPPLERTGLLGPLDTLEAEPTRMGTGLPLPLTRLWRR